MSAPFQTPPTPPPPCCPSPPHPLNLTDHKTSASIYSRHEMSASVNGRIPNARTAPHTITAARPRKPPDLTCAR
eukprot:175303-Chlamydomonas_euryale.AAC.1